MKVLGNIIWWICGGLEAAVGYFLGSSLKNEFDGILTLTFDENGRKLNFFYKLESGGLRLEDAQRAQFKNSLAVDRSSNPIVMFFAK